jgi:hypothetical protein
LIRFLIATHILLYSTIAGFCQDLTPDSITWNKNFKLGWTDFQGRPDSLENWQAVSAIVISIKGFKERSRPKFQVTNQFIRSRSWTKNKESEKLLKHERLHFELSEVYARKMRKLIAEAVGRKIKNYYYYYDIVKKVSAKNDLAHQQYDKETYYGTIDQEQQRWQEYISKELYSLRKYSD